MRTPVLSLSALALLAACGSNDASTTGGAAKPTGGTFIYATPGDPTDIFPAFIAEQTGDVVASLVFDHLADISNDLQTTGDKGFTPRLAKSWTWAPDSLSITFSLDPRARWHDGKPVTAADVRYTLKVFTDSATATPAASLLANVDSASVKDSTTVVFWFKKHTPEEFYDVAYQLFILPEHVYGSIPLGKLRTSEATRTLIGSGQYRFVTWQPDVRIELVADTANYHGRPPIDRVILAPASDPNTLLTQVLTEQADFMQNYPPDLVSQAESSKVIRPLVLPALQYVFMEMNLYAPKSKMVPHPLFSDVRVRRAISMALDRQGMLQNVFQGKGLIGRGPFPMSQTASDSTLKLPRYDTAAAAALLDSAGWHRDAKGWRSKFGKPMRFTLIVPQPSIPRTKYATLIQDQLKRVGIQMEIRILDPKVIMSRIQPGANAADFDAILNQFGTDPSPTDVRQFWGTAGIGPQGQNAGRYSNPKVDALIDSMAASFDPATVKKDASRIYQMIIDDAPAVWLYDQSGMAVVNRRINVGPIRADGWYRSFGAWSISPDKRIDRDRIGLNPSR